MKTVQSPDGVALLLENLWLRHRAGLKQRPDNVYMIEFPPPTEEELAAAREPRDVRHETALPDEDDSEEIYGVWI